MSKRKKPRKTYTKKSIDSMYMGDEPVWDDVTEMSQGDLNRALNWYNYMGSTQHARKYLVEYYKTQGIKEMIPAIRSAPDYKVNTTAGWLARLSTRGAPLNESSIAFIGEHTEPLLEYHKEKHETIKVVKNPKTIQQRLAEKAGEMIGELEHQIDEFINSDFLKPFNAYDSLVELEAKGKHSEHIVKHFTPNVEELQAVIDKSDPDLVEGYKLYKVAQVKAMLKQYQDIVDSAQTIINNASKTRKTKVKKVKGKDPNKSI